MLSSLHAGGSNFRLYEDLSIGVIVGGADALAVCRALRGLPVGFLSFAGEVGAVKPVTGLRPPVKYFTDRSKAQGGTLIFSAYVGSDPASTVHPQKISGISSTPKKYLKF